MSDIYSVDVVLIGAGVVGLACARALAMQGREVIVLETEDIIASHTSSRNSEVIHAGLYYAKGSMKAHHCVNGRRKLYKFLDERSITHKNCGKLVVAVTDKEAENLAALKARAETENDVEGLEILDGAGALALEPALNPDVRGAIRSSVSGIFDSHAYFLALQGDLEDNGGMIAFGSPVIDGRSTPEGVILETGGEAPSTLKANLVINAAGHHSITVASLIDGAHTNDLPTPRFVKGSYFSVSGKTPFSQLIYPMPTSSSLGLHLTIDLGGRGKVGPDAEWLDADATPPFDYEVDEARAEIFHREVSRYWPDLELEQLAPDYAGVRPKLVQPGEPSGDFLIQGPETHGTPGLINLLGIESPGLTSSLSIAEHVARIAAESA